MTRYFSISFHLIIVSVLLSVHLLGQVTIKDTLTIGPHVRSIATPPAGDGETGTAALDTSGVIVTVKYYYRACDGYGIVHTSISPCDAYHDSAVGNTVSDMSQQGLAKFQFHAYDRNPLTPYTFLADPHFDPCGSVLGTCFHTACNDSIVVTDNRGSPPVKGTGSRPTVQYQPPLTTACTVNNSQPQTFDPNSVEILQEGSNFTWSDNAGPHILPVGDVCSLSDSTPGWLVNGATNLLARIPPTNLGPEPPPLIYLPGNSDVGVSPCLDNATNKWKFTVQNLRVPLFESVCLQKLQAAGHIDFGDGSNWSILRQYISSCDQWHDLRRWINFLEKGSHFDSSRSDTVPPPTNFGKVYFTLAILAHEAQHGHDKVDSLSHALNDSAFTQIFAIDAPQSNYPCARNALDGYKDKVLRILSQYYNKAATKDLSLKDKKKADAAAVSVYEQIKKNILLYVHSFDDRCF